MGNCTSEERRISNRKDYLARRAKSYAAGFRAIGPSRIQRGEITFEQALQEASTRFWSRVRKDDDGCWRWTACLDDHGYGRLTVGGQTMKANRVAYLLTHGALQAGRKVLHTCDNPACVNPAHLWVGTQPENLADMVNKGRQSRGVTRPLAKLNDSKVALMRQLHAAGKSFACLAKQFGVCRAVVYRIVHRKSWMHVPPSEHSNVKPSDIIR